MHLTLKVCLGLSLSIILGASSCNTKEQKSPLLADNASIEAPVIDESLSLDFICGRFSPEEDSSFVEIDMKYADKKGMFMKRAAYDAFIEMYNAAQEDGFLLVIRSAARNFEYQKKIWERKWSGQTILSDGSNAQLDYPDPLTRAKKILEYSSMPGTSRHHWGTDVDFNSFDNSWFEQGEGLMLFTWLEKNASLYGFCRPYTAFDENRKYGYNEEKWHWSYVPLAKKYTRFAEARLKDEDISGFLGAELSQELSVVEKYVLGINPECK